MPHQRVQAHDMRIDEDFSNPDTGSTRISSPGSTLDEWKDTEGRAPFLPSVREQCQQWNAVSVWDIPNLGKKALMQHTVFCFSSFDACKLLPSFVIFFHTRVMAKNDVVHEAVISTWTPSDYLPFCSSRGTLRWFRATNGEAPENRIMRGVHSWHMHVVPLVFWGTFPSHTVSAQCQPFESRNQPYTVSQIMTLRMAGILCMRSGLKHSWEWSAWTSMTWTPSTTPCIFCLGKSITVLSYSQQMVEQTTWRCAFDFCTCFTHTHIHTREHQKPCVYTCLAHSSALDMHLSGVFWWLDTRVHAWM